MYDFRLSAVLVYHLVRGGPRYLYMFRKQIRVTYLQIVIDPVFLVRPLTIVFTERWLIHFSGLPHHDEWVMAYTCPLMAVRNVL